MNKLKDVATAAGVSVASASRALNGLPTVSEEIRRRVVAAAGRLGYRPNLSARALATGVRSIAILAPSLADPFTASVVEASANAIRDRGHRAMIIVGPEGDDGRLEVLALAGVVLVGRHPEVVERGRLAQVPSLGVADGRSDTGAQVELGLARGCELVCQYLKAEGHRRVALLAAIDAASAASLASRVDGMTLEPFPAGSPASVAAQLRQMFDRTDPPTAVVCGTDGTALAALRYCAIEGIRVPANVSIVGFGDGPLARYSLPALSSVRVSAEAIGASVADAILELALGRMPTPAPIQASVRLVIRESSGPVRDVSRGA